MKHLILIVLALTGFTPGFAQQTAAPDLVTIADTKAWKIAHATAETVEMDGRHAVRLKAEGDSANRIIGQALATGVEFSTGVIEVDLKGKNIKQQSFLGVVFNVVDERTFEAVYFRPFNFRADEPFRGRAVQYIAWPENTWEKLRKERPGRFENRINPVPDPEGWFHARIEVGATQVRVFVDGAKEPCLTVDRLAAGAGGKPVGLFVDVADGIYANLKVTPDAASVCIPGTSDTAAIEQAVLAANAEMTAAANSLDTDAFFAHIVDTDRGLIVQNGTIFRTRREAYEAVKRGLQGVAKIERKFEDPRVTVIAPDVALLVADGRTIATLADGRAMDSRFAVSVVWVLSEGRWKVLHGHYSMPGARP